MITYRVSGWREIFKPWFWQPYRVQRLTDSRRAALISAASLSLLLVPFYLAVNRMVWMPEWVRAEYPAIAATHYKPSKPEAAPAVPSRPAIQTPMTLPADTAPTTPVELARILNANRFGDAHWEALHNLWSRESRFDPSSRNPSSGACGIPQALPCSKIGDMSAPGQIMWGLDYIAGRYGTPTRAWHWWQSHGWY